jgi:hypothetical protein
MPDQQTSEIDRPPTCRRAAWLLALGVLTGSTFGADSRDISAELEVERAKYPLPACASAVVIPPQFLGQATLPESN